MACGVLTMRHAPSCELASKKCAFDAAQPRLRHGEVVPPLRPLRSPPMTTRPAPVNGRRHFWLLVFVIHGLAVHLWAGIHLPSGYGPVGYSQLTPSATITLQPVQIEREKREQSRLATELYPHRFDFICPALTGCDIAHTQPCGNVLNYVLVRTTKGVATGRDRPSLRLFFGPGFGY
jgi:hypothetical protein